MKILDSFKKNLLRNTLIANGIFSVFTMLLAILFGNMSAAIYHMAGENITNFTIQSIIFGGFVFYNAYRKKVSKIMIFIIIGLDALYVLGATARVIFDPYPTIGGKVLIAFTAIVVALFAIYQFKGLRAVIRKRKLIQESK